MSENSELSAAIAVCNQHGLAVVPREPTDNFIDAFNEKQNNHRYGGFTYGENNVIRDHQEEEKQQKTVIIWKRTINDDENLSDRLMTIELDKLRFTDGYKAMLQAGEGNKNGK